MEKRVRRRVHLSGCSLSEAKAKECSSSLGEKSNSVPFDKLKRIHAYTLFSYTSFTMSSLVPEEDRHEQPKSPRKVISPRELHQQEIDISTLSPQDQEFYRMYKRLPPANKRGVQMRGIGDNKKVFDSADYFMEAEKVKKDSDGATGAPPKNKLPPHMRKKHLQ